MALPTLTNGVNPLTWNVPIVNPNGTPTDAFMRLWQQQFATNAQIPDLTTPSGVSGVLDLIGATKGSLIYRDTFVWNALPPATGHDGWLLTFNNTTGLPEWRAAAGAAGVPAAIFIDGSALGQMALVDPDGFEVLDGSGKAVYITNPTLPNAMIPPTLGITNGVAIAAGYVGEQIKSTVLIGSAVPLTTNVGANITFIDLTPGFWGVNCNTSFTGGATTNVTELNGGISLNSATLPTTGDLGRVQNSYGAAGLVVFNPNNMGFCAGPQFFNVTVNTRVYLVGQAGFTVSTCAAYGSIIATRVA